MFHCDLQRDTAVWRVPSLGNIESVNSLLFLDSMHSNIHIEFLHVNVILWHWQYVTFDVNSYSWDFTSA